MTLNIFLTEEAKETLDITLSFVREIWGKKLEAKIQAEIIKVLKLIST